MKWLVFLGLVFFAGCHSPEGPRPLVVGMDLSYPPFETIDERGAPAGVSVEMARELATSLGRPLSIENIPFVGLIPALQQGRVDCVISSMTVTEERKKSVAFSDSYLRTGLALLAGASGGLEAIEDVPGRTYAVRQGTTGEIWAREHLKQAHILAVDKENAAVLEVIQGKVDGFIYDQMSVWTHSQKYPEKVRALLRPLQTEEWAVALRPGDEGLRQSINDFLASFRERGGFDRLADQFLAAQKRAFEAQGVPFVF